MSNVDKENNSTTLGQLFSTEYNRIVGYVRKRMKETAEQDAEDVVQDVFYSLINRPDFSAPIEYLATYMYQALCNRITEIFRKRKPTESLDAPFTQPAHQTLYDIITDDRYLPERHVSQVETIDLLNDCLQQVSDEERALIVANEIDGISFKDLSEEWNVPINTLLSKKSRAMRKIAAYLAAVQIQGE